MKRMMTVGFLLAIMTAAAAAETKVFPLEGMVRPQRIEADKTQLYVIDGVNVFIFSRKDLKLVKTFGKTGEGPGEFQAHPNDAMPIDVSTESIMVKSRGRLSFFSKTGEFQRMVASGAGAIAAKVLGNGFVGVNRKRDGKRTHFTINLYDEKAKIKKELVRCLDEFQQGEGMLVLRYPYQYHYIFAVGGGNVFTALDKEFEIKVFDAEGKYLYSIKGEPEKKEVPQELKKKIVHNWKTDPIKKQYYHVVKPIRVADYYPPVRFLKFADGNVYALTYNTRDKKTECLVFKAKGDYLGTAYLPIREKDVLEAFPFAVSGGKLYQITETEDEEWELHVDDILVK